MGQEIKKASLSLTYDLADLSHIETVLPQLDKFDHQATFYMDGPRLLEKLSHWKNAQKAGHEIGNGTLLHQTEDGSLPLWKFEAIESDVNEMKGLIEELFPHQQRHSLAGYCDQAECAEGNYFSLLEKEYEVIRTERHGFNLQKTRWNSLKSLSADDLSSDQLIELARTVMRNGAYGIFIFHGVGSGVKSLDAAEHEKFLKFLSFSEDLVQVKPVVSCFEASHRQKKPSISEKKGGK